MFPLRTISGFLLRTTVCYTVFMIPWPGVRDAYRSCFRAVGNVAFASVRGAGAVRFEPYSSDDQRKDTRLVLEKYRPFTVRGRTELQSILLGYRPIAFLVALTVGAPITWRRRLWALLWGLIFVNLFIAFRVWIPILIGFSGDNQLALYSFPPVIDSLLGVLKLVLVQAPVVHYMAPTFIWMVVTFRRGDLQRILLGRSSAKGEAATQ